MSLCGPIAYRKLISVPIRVLALLVVLMGVVAWKVPGLHAPERAHNVIPQLTHHSPPLSGGPANAEYWDPSLTEAGGVELDLALSWRQLPASSRQAWLGWMIRGESTPGSVIYPSPNRLEVFRSLAWSQLTPSERKALSPSGAGNLQPFNGADCILLPGIVCGGPFYSRKPDQLPMWIWGGSLALLFFIAVRTWRLHLHQKIVLHRLGF